MFLFDVASFVQWSSTDFYRIYFCFRFVKPNKLGILRLNQWASSGSEFGLLNPYLFLLFWFSSHLSRYVVFYYFIFRPAWGETKWEICFRYQGAKNPQFSVFLQHLNFVNALHKMGFWLTFLEIYQILEVRTVCKRKNKPKCVGQVNFKIGFRK